MMDRVIRAPPQGCSILDKTCVRVSLAAGGSKGPVHIGVLKRLSEEDDLKIVDVSGSSVGAIVAIFDRNGFKHDDITRIFIEALAKREDPALQLSMLPTGLKILDPAILMTGSLRDLRGPMKKMVDRYRLQAKATIFAFDLLRHRLVRFRPEKYDPAFALAAACGFAPLFRPVWRWGRDGLELLGDAASYHYSPPDDFDSPAIFSVFDSATKVPDKGWPVDIMLGLREVFGFPLAGGSTYVDEKKHLVVSTKPRYPGLFMAINEKDVHELVEMGYNAADEALAKWRAEGRIQ
jgi:hypothetical protein